MKNNLNLNPKKSALSRFFSGKGFYVALALCLFGAAGATWYSVDKALSGIGNDPLAEEAGRNQSDVSIVSSSSQDSGESQNTQNESSDVGAMLPEQHESSAQSAALFLMPISGEIITAFSNNEVVKNKTLNDWRTHDGIDIKAAQATPVKAISDGVVSKIYEDPLFGTVMVISHEGGIESYYGNLNSLVSVKEGQQVTLGQIVGSVGATALSETSLESHLHFGVKKNNEWQNPFEVMSIPYNTEE